MYEHGRCSEFLEFPFCGNHRHDHPFLGGWVQTNFMGIFLSSADKPRFLATKGFGGGGGGGRVSQYTLHCPAALQCAPGTLCPDTLHCKGSQWVTQWVTMLDVHRPHTHYMGHNGFDNGAGQEEGVAWFWTNALFQVVNVRRPPLLSFCPTLRFSMSGLLLDF